VTVLSSWSSVTRSTGTWAPKQTRAAAVSLLILSGSFNVGARLVSGDFNAELEMVNVLSSTLLGPVSGPPLLAEQEIPLFNLRMKAVDGNN
jgi:hypothetical protein